MTGIDTDIVHTLTPYDILCGRGKNAHNNIGNRRCRLTMTMNLEAYLLCKSKCERTVLVGSIVDYLVEDVGACFLKPEKDGGFYEMTETKAREKVAHALRDMAVSKKQTTMKEWTKQERRTDRILQRQKHILESMMNSDSEDDDSSSLEAPTPDLAPSSCSSHLTSRIKQIEPCDAVQFSQDTLSLLDSIAVGDWGAFSEQICVAQ